MMRSAGRPVKERFCTDIQQRARHCGLRLEAYLSGIKLNVRRRTFGGLRISYCREI
ncbi:protein of unknown function [Paraburkholderia dioscoreae]|uniref:Uncharacterized protein n=1 Tax=Paraburkholderia dioscoreae TaxID=2604047 RepID=A0A5Q4Z9H8_9BURK|nr:protein of unknown function [Paraburkholderia dioscoreae]